MIENGRNQVQTTFVIPNYNHARYLPECLEAIFAQKNAVAKIIFIDDASNDESWSVAGGLLEGMDNVTIVRHAENQGVVACLNEGLALVDTPYVAFTAADDRLLPQFLEISQAALLTAPEAALATSETDIIDEAGKYRAHRPTFPPAFRSGYIPPTEVRELLLESDNFLIGNVALYRAELLRKFGGFDPRIGALCDGLVMRVLAARYGFYFVRRTLGNWRWHGQNYSMAEIALPTATENMIAEARRYIERHDSAACLPPNYDELLARRLRFGAARLSIEEREYRVSGDIDLGAAPATGVRKVPGLTAFLRIVTRAPIRPLRAFFVNLCLYLIYRPFKMSTLIRHYSAKLVRTLATAINPRKHSAS